jgi:hypothetical protein
MQKRNYYLVISRDQEGSTANANINYYSVYLSPGCQERFFVDVLHLQDLKAFLIGAILANVDGGIRFSQEGILSLGQQDNSRLVLLKDDLFRNLPVFPKKVQLLRNLGTALPLIASIYVYPFLEALTGA